MPNWCWNTLVVQGHDSDEVERFVERNRGPEGVLSFNALVPMPEGISMAESVDEGCDGRNLENWYGWRLANWGTKWDLSDEDLELSGGPFQQTYTFMTAWNPPLAWLRTVAPMFPGLRFTLHYSKEDPNEADALTTVVLLVQP